MKKVFVTWHDVQRQTQDILRQLQIDNWQPDYVVGITRGGLTVANLISQYLDVRMYTLDVRLRDGKPEDCESNCWMAEEAFGYNDETKTGIFGARWDPSLKKKILIVDDINDSGATLNWIKQDWEASCSPSRDNSEHLWNLVWENTVRVAVLYDNTASESKLPIRYCAEEINKVDDPSWIVFPWEEWWKRWDPGVKKEFFDNIKLQQEFAPR